jgi:hypothetical protein
VEKAVVVATLQHLEACWQPNQTAVAPAQPEMGADRLPELTA